jgi:hypothetical protein
MLPQITELRDLLRARKGASEKEFGQLDALMATCGASSRAGDLFGKNSISAKMVSAVKVSMCAKPQLVLVLV